MFRSPQPPVDSGNSASWGSKFDPLCQYQPSSGQASEEGSIHEKDDAASLQETLDEIASKARAACGVEVNAATKSAVLKSPIVTVVNDEDEDAEPGGGHFSMDGGGTESVGAGPGGEEPTASTPNSNSGHTGVMGSSHQHAPISLFSGASLNLTPVGVLPKTGIYLKLLCLKNL